MERVKASDNKPPWLKIEVWYCFKPTGRVAATSSLCITLPAQRPTANEKIFGRCRVAAFHLRGVFQGDMLGSRKTYTESVSLISIAFMDASSRAKNL